MVGINVANSSVALLVMLCTLGSALLEKRRFRTERSFLPAVLSAALGMDAGTLLAWLARGMHMQRAFFAFLSVSVVFYYAVLAFFVCGIRAYLADRGVSVRWMAWSTVPVCAVSAIAWIASNFTGAFYTMDALGNWSPGRYYLIGQLGGYWVAGVTIFLVLRHRKAIGRNVSLAFLSYPLLPLISAPLQRLVPGLHLMLLLLSAALLQIYNFIHLEQAVQLHRRETRLTQDRIAISLSQIQPHFLYNTLNSIYYLCDDRPAAAQNAIDDFIAYLRRNLESMEQEVEIPVRREMEHVQHYLRLEQVRFGEELCVDYCMEAQDFNIPSLTIQPLAENAVKHGLMGREGGGRVSIRSRELDSCYEITVTDDGVGFDPAQPPSDDRLHIGIQNVRERLRVISRGELVINSTPGVGTTAVIRIPKHAAGTRQGKGKRHV